MSILNPPSHLQLRAARAMLGWSQDDLAVRASLNAQTVSEMETGTRVALSSILAMQQELEAAGIRFTFDREAGNGIVLAHGSVTQAPPPARLRRSPKHSFDVC